MALPRRRDGTAGCKLVLLCGSPSAGSRSSQLGAAIAADVRKVLGGSVEPVDLAAFAGWMGAGLERPHADRRVEHALAAVESCDALVVATPVYRGSYPGLLKHFFDLLRQDALCGVPVVLAANGGSPLHALMIEHQLRPLLSFFQAITLPVGVYASDGDFHEGRIASARLAERIRLASAQFAIFGAAMTMTQPPGDCTCPVLNELTT